MHKLGDEVWVYLPPLKPANAIIKKVLTHGIKCSFFGRLTFLDSGTYSRHQIFARPADWSKLVETIRDDAESMLIEAERLEKLHR